MKKDNLPPEIQEIITAQLMAEEELLWAGQPDPLRLARRNILQAGFGVIWLVFVGYIFNNFAFGFQGMSLFSLMPLLFLGVGLWMISTPLRDYISALRTSYAVTSQRAIIISGLLHQSVQSYGARQIEFVNSRVYSSGLGDVIFDRETRVRRSRNTGSSTYQVEIGFFGIPNPRQVEALMLQRFVYASS